MFLNTESEIPCLTEITFLQFIFLDFQSSLKNLLRFRPTNSDVDGDFFVSADTEGTYCVASLQSTPTLQSPAKPNSNGRIDLDVRVEVRLPLSIREFDRIIVQEL